MKKPHSTFPLLHEAVFAVRVIQTKCNGLGAAVLHSGWSKETIAAVLLFLPL